MTEAQKIQAQMKVLIETIQHLTHRRPEDIDIERDLTQKIEALSARFQNLMAGPPLDPLSPAAVHALGAAVSKLENAVKSSAVATAILQAATDLANA